MPTNSIRTQNLSQDLNNPAKVAEISANKTASQNGVKISASKRTSSKSECKISTVKLSIATASLLLPLGLCATEYVYDPEGSTTSQELKQESNKVYAPDKKDAKLTIKSTKVDDENRDFYAGYDENSQNIESNTLILENGTIRNAYGGFSFKGDVTSNKVIIKGKNTKVIDGVFGGFSFNGNVNENSVSVGGGNFTEEIFGGYSENDSANINSVTITDGTFANDVHGGYAFINGSAIGNSVSVADGKFESSIYDMAENQLKAQPPKTK